MKNFRFTTKLLMGAAIAFAAMAPLTSCSDDDDDEDVTPNPPAASGPTAQEQAFANHFTSQNNSSFDVGMLSRTSLIPANTPSTGDMPPANDPFYSQVNYKGAFGTTDWTDGWTYLSGDKRTFDNNKPTKTITDADISGSVIFDKDTIYILQGFVFVDQGETLTIEAGTVIKGKPGQGASASALIVAVGGTINANGTAADPIIMTYEGDNGTPQANNITGEWGGLIILGDAELNSNPGQTQIEGIPTTETRGLYGGTDNTDNSGTLRYVSIRHGGTDIGAGNEINGLSLGGVGSGTTIEYIEVAPTKDDGVEWFGGTVNTKYLVVAYAGDDSFDYDEGFRGKGQFWLTVQGPDGDRGGEHDGGTDPETAMPFATPVVYNATFIGNGLSGSRAITFRDNAGGQYHNSIFYNFGRGIDIEDLPSGEDSYARFEAGELALRGNVFSNIAAGTNAGDLFTVTVP